MKKYEDILSNIEFKTEHLLYLLPIVLILGDWLVAAGLITFIFLFLLKDLVLLQRSKFFFPNKLNWFLLLTWGLYIVTKSEFGTGVYYFVGIIVVPLILFVLILNIQFKYDYIVRFFNLLFVSGIVLSFISFYFLYMNDFNYTLRIGSLWENINIVSAYFLILFMFCLSFIIHKKKGQSIVFYIVVLVLLGIAIFLTQTRGVWLALLFSLIVYYIKRPKIYLMIILFFGLLFVAFQDVIITRFLTIKNFGSDVSSLGRLQAWFASVVLIKDNIFTGYGFDSFMRLRDDVFYFYIVPVIHSHNTYLRSLLEMGLIGTVIYFTFLIKALFYTYKLKKKCTNEYIGLIDGLQLSFLSLFIVFMFEPYFSLFGCSTIVIWFLISLSYKLKYQFLEDDNS